ncbi:hypothetical protein C9374_006066 [Naegleria lovaniensis]|uniref:Fatty acid 2-hydroxylase n=1 Tax=Naegleria lovaniensis TaxID=51637 RepID=A0AA88GNW1_NAELO|nr:uncharacterized protein C9374_006066 [Naegleria lovaniensis]KAG2381682.1 hypothetical protein C9374_006066 [Naegleria lovaniensis]
MISTQYSPHHHQTLWSSSITSSQTARDGETTNTSVSSSPDSSHSLIPTQERFYTKEQVAQHNTEHDAWVIVHEHVYDISEFCETHPGGTDILLDYLGSDITKVLQDASLHKHSSSAYSMLKRYRIGKLNDEATAVDETQISKSGNKTQSCTNTTTSEGPGALAESALGATTNDETISMLLKGKDPVDYSKPLLDQIGKLGKEYFDWVSYSGPVYFKESVPLFSNKYLEMTSHTQWYVVLVVWLPVGKDGFYVTNIIHFLLHGFHHKLPMDKDRLVVPVALFTILSSPFVFAAHSVLPSYAAHAVIAGAFMGYVFYDMHHYWLHHAANAARAPEPFRTFFTSQRWQTLKTHHFIHHFAPGGDEKNYGISNRIVDILFGSLREHH